MVGHSQMYGEVWHPCRKYSNGIRQAMCFADYLSSYVELLESISSQLTEGPTSSAMGGLGRTVQCLFASSRIDCDGEGAWATTGLGKGKGKNWILATDGSLRRGVGGRQAVRVRLP